MKGLEGKPPEEQLRSLGLFSLQENEGRPHCGLQHPHEGKWRCRHQSHHSYDQRQDLRK